MRAPVGRFSSHRHVHSARLSNRNKMHFFLAFRALSPKSFTKHSYKSSCSLEVAVLHSNTFLLCTPRMHKELHKYSFFFCFFLKQNKSAFKVFRPAHTHKFMAKRALLLCVAIGISVVQFFFPTSSNRILFYWRKLNNFENGADWNSNGERQRQRERE